MVVSETGRVNGSEQSPPATHPAVRLQAHRGHASRIPCRTASAILSARRMGATHQGGAGARPACGADASAQQGRGDPGTPLNDAYHAGFFDRLPWRDIRGRLPSPRHLSGAFSCPAPSARGWARRAPPGRRDRDRPSLTAELVALRCRAGILLPRGDIHGAETQPARPRRHPPPGF